jgi:hypothetical protein
MKQPDAALNPSPSREAAVERGAFLPVAQRSVWEKGLGDAGQNATP